MLNNFQNHFLKHKNIYYLGIGRPQPFATLTRGDSRTDFEGTDTNPITPVIRLLENFIHMTT